jgi:hypothetical protein
MISTTENAPDDPLRDGSNLSGGGVVADGPLLVAAPMMTVLEFIILLSVLVMAAERFLPLT